MSEVNRWWCEVSVLFLLASWFCWLQRLRLGFDTLCKQLASVHAISWWSVLHNEAIHFLLSYRVLETWSVHDSPTNIRLKKIPPYTSYSNWQVLLQGDMLKQAEFGSIARNLFRMSGTWLFTAKMHGILCNCRSTMYTSINFAHSCCQQLLIKTSRLQVKQ